jgi:hypothetical protein
MAMQTLSRPLMILTEILTKAVEKEREKEKRKKRETRLTTQRMGLVRRNKKTGKRRIMRETSPRTTPRPQKRLFRSIGQRPRKGIINKPSSDRQSSENTLQGSQKT